MNRMKIGLWCALASCSLASFSLAGPKEDAFAVVEQFKKSFEASDAEAVTNLFAKDSIFLGTQMQGPTTQRDVILKYFVNSLGADKPRRLEVENYLAVQISETAFVFSGQNKFGRTKDGKEMETPARFSFVVTKGAEGWRISHFHSSLRPRPPQ